MLENFPLIVLQSVFLGVLIYLVLVLSRGE